MAWEAIGPRKEPTTAVLLEEYHHYASQYLCLHIDSAASPRPDTIFSVVSS